MATWSPSTSSSGTTASWSTNWGSGLAGDHLLGLLRDEILEVDGVTIETLRPVDGPLPDRHAELLDIATELFVQVSPDALLDRLADRVRRSLVADFAAVVDADTTRVAVAHGDAPPDDEDLRAMALWAVAPLAPPVGADESGRPVPTRARGWPPPRWCGPAWSWWWAGRAPVFRSRERQWIAIMAELADHGWRELA